MVSETQKLLSYEKIENFQLLPLSVVSKIWKDEEYYKWLGMTDSQSQHETLLSQFFLHFLVYLEKNLTLF